MSIEHGGYIPHEAKNFKPTNYNNMTEKISIEMQRQVAESSIINRGYITQDRWNELTNSQKEIAIKTEIERADDAYKDAIRAREYSLKLLETVEGMTNKPATYDDLRKSKPILAAIKGLDKEKSGMLERRLSDEDQTTGIPGRERQNDKLRSEIFERVKGDDLKKSARTLGMVNFDLRSLKLVNDSVSNHEMGDEYLRRVAQKAKELGDEIGKLLGAEVSIARDGGDEFSIVFSSENVDLEDQLSDGELKNLIENDVAIGKTRVIDAISQYLTQEVGKMVHNDLFFSDSVNQELLEAGKSEEEASDPREHMRIALEKFANTGIFDPELYATMPSEFNLNSFIASGGATLHEVINNPETADYKKLENPQSDLHALNLLAGAMRARSDKEAYYQKELQNQEITSNKTETNEFRKLLLSRNEFTRSIILDNVKLERELKNCQSKIKE